MKKLLSLVAVLMLSFSAYPATDMEKQYREFKQATQERIDKVEVELSKIGDKIASLSGDAKEEMKDQYEVLVDKKDMLKEKLSDAGDVTADKWDTFKDNVEDLADDLESKVDKAI